MQQTPYGRAALAAMASLLLLLSAAPAMAAHPLITDDTGTQGKGRFQIEVNAEYAHARSEGVTATATQLASTLSYGVSDPFDIVLAVPYQFVRLRDSGISSGEEGLSDVTLEAKWRFYDRDGLSLALKPGVSLPTGDGEKGLGAGKTGYHLFFIGSKEIETWAFHLNAGYLRNDNRAGEIKDLWHASAAATLRATGDLTLAANIGIETNAARDANGHPAFILGGVVYSVTEDLDLDIGIKGGLTRPETDYAVLTGITYRF